MTIFPSLIPSQRNWTPGDYPSTSFTALNLREGRVLHSNLLANSKLQLVFIGLDEADMLAILLHYQEQLGSFSAFDLPSQVFSGVSNAADYTRPGYQWRYAEIPAVEDLPCGSHVVTVALESSFTFAANEVIGTNLVVNFSLTAGSGIGNTVDGLSATVSVSFLPGEADAFVPAVFSAIAYTGFGNIRSLTGLGFRPGFIWIQQRTGTTGQIGASIWDHLRGVTSYWQPSSGSGIFTTTTDLLSFDADGFTLDNGVLTNVFGRTYVARCIAEGGASTSNTDGSITTTVRSNLLAGLSIFSYSGTGNADTVGHGLGGTPDLVIFQRGGGSANTGVVTPGLIADTKWLQLNLSNAEQPAGTSVTAMSSTTISLAAAADFGNWWNGSGGSYTIYAFKSVTGASKIDTYTGQGATATTVTCGFAPEFIMIKSITASGDWLLFDLPRGAGKQLLANSVVNETDVDKIIFNSNGFTVKANENANTSAVNYLYMAFK
jgi:hypothetical protein